MIPRAIPERVIRTTCVMIAAVAHFLASWENDLQEGLRTYHFTVKYVCI